MTPLQEVIVLALVALSVGGAVVLLALVVEWFLDEVER